MEDLKVINGKVQLDDGSEIDLKTVLMPETEYGDWIEDESITLIKAYLDQEEYEMIKGKDIDYKETNFIEDDFWFDLDSFHFVLTSNDYLYDRIYHLKFIIIIFNPEKEVIQTLNFTKRTKK